MNHKSCLSQAMGEKNEMYVSESQYTLIYNKKDNY